MRCKFTPCFEYLCAKLWGIVVVFTRGKVILFGKIILKRGSINSACSSMSYQRGEIRKNHGKATCI